MPFIWIRLLWRSFKQPAYRERLAERLGYYPFQLEKCIWLHSVSVGETLAALPLIKGLKSRFPHLPLVVTTMTPTGAAQVKTSLGDTVIHAYIPYDLPGATKRFLNTVHPLMGIIMETELWPNLLAACKQNEIPVCLVNARLSEKSAKGYRRIASITRSMLQQLTLIAAHGERDAKRFIELGALKERVFVTGNIKFDLELSPDLLEKGEALRQVLGKDRRIWIAASTHEGEEEIILNAHQKIREQYPDALLILVPRHPNRFDTVAMLCEPSFVIVRRSKSEFVHPKTSIYLGDTMGELLLMYSASDIVFVGGSLIPRGGHNMLEPAALGKPILTGPHLYNFNEISELFVAEKALIKITSAETLAQQIIRMMQNEEERLKMSERVLKVVATNRGALAKQLDLVSKILRENLL